jgi:maleate isomerase
MPTPQVISRAAQRGDWPPDGWDAGVRIGLLVPHADVGPESELQAMAPPGVSIHAARVPFGAMGAGGAMDPTIPLAPVRAFCEPPHVDIAAELLAAAPVHVVAYGFTSSAYVIGVEAEAAMIARLATRTRGIPVVAASAATVAALRETGARRIALVSPPWFDAELDRLGRGYYESAGFDVVRSGPCDLPSDQARITPSDLYDQVCAHTPADAEAVVISGNGFRAVGVIAAVEQTLGRPLVTANQTLLWAALKAAEADPSTVAGYGRIFGHRDGNSS